MVDDERATPETLRAEIAESREVSERTRELLADPEGFKILTDLQDNADRAVRAGRYDVAGRLLEHIKDIQEKEEALRSARKASDEKERHAIRVLRETEC